MLELCDRCPTATQAECRARVVARAPVLCERGYTIPVVDRQAALAAGYRVASRSTRFCSSGDLVYTPSPNNDTLILFDRPPGGGPPVAAQRFVSL